MTRARPVFALALTGCPDAFGIVGPAPEAFSNCRTADGHYFEIADVDSGDRVQASLEIWHGGPVDACDALVHETLQLDLTPLRTAWQELHGEGAASLSISLAGTSDPLVYSFE